jgi:hypothetical protein
MHYSIKMICLPKEKLDNSRQEIQRLHNDAMECEPLHLWYQMVRQFCVQNITFEEDSLPAISGLAREAQKTSRLWISRHLQRSAMVCGRLRLISVNICYPILELGFHQKQQSNAPIMHRADCS